MDSSRLRNPLNQPHKFPQTERGTESSQSSTTRLIQSINTLKPPSNPRNTSNISPPPGGNHIGGALFPATNSSQRSGGRSKVRLEPGHSPLDWANLNSGSKNLRGIHPSDFPLRVNKEMLKMHKTQNDCWTVLSGKVYNITPYLKFHPGGIDELMKCAGKDGTSLFMKYHAWVNFEKMLENCLVGFYIGQ